MLDIVKYDYEVPFVIYSADDKDTIIMYQKFSDNHELGYKIFDKILKKWSNFIDSSKYPFNDYSAIIANGILHALYIKKEKDIDIVNYVNGNFTTFNINKISKCKNIKLCSIFIIHAQIWCLWIDDSKIYSIFSLDNGNHFSTSTYQQSVSSSNIFKFIYISNKPKEQKSILGNEIYFADDSDMKYLIFSDFYPYFKTNKESGHHLSFIEYYMNEIHLAISSYENTSKQKEQLTTQLKYQFQEQKAQNLFYERKFKSINNAYTRFIDLKNQLNEHVTLLQESLNDKEKELALLQNLNIERDNEIQTIKEELSKNINLLQESLTDKEENLTLLQNSNIEKDNEIQTIKLELSQNISSLQERLTDREEKLALLENFSIEKDNEIQSLKKKLSQDESKILYLIAKVKSLNGKIRNTYINIYKNLNMYR